MSDDEPASEAPLPSGSTESPESGAAPPPDATSSGPLSRPPAPAFKLSTFVLMFLFLLGLVMIFDTSTRLAVAQDLNLLLYPAIGFGGSYVLLTMLIAGAVEMAITAAAYSYTTDWVKAAKLTKFSSALRPVQMRALRSGKKDKIDALKPHQATLNKLSMDVQFAQLKGMAITWFLLISIYSWVGFFLVTTSDHAVTTVSLGGASVNLLAPIVFSIPLWFLLFSVYTVPFNLALRRLFKHVALKRLAAERAALPAA